MSTEVIDRSDAADELVDRRRHKRHRVLISATLHAHGKSQATIIDDLSVGGAGLKGAIGIFANDNVEIEFADGRRIPGQVAWWMSGCCGVRFDELLDATDPLFSDGIDR